MRKPATSLLLLSVFASVCGVRAQQTSISPAPSRSQQNEPATTLKVDVNLVNVFVTVTDLHGAPIGGLAKENFILKEDDQPQKIAVFDKESALIVFFEDEIFFG